MTPKLNASIEKSIKGSDLILNEKQNNGLETKEHIKRLSQSIRPRPTTTNEASEKLLKLKENALLNKGLASSQEKAFYDYGILSESGHYYGNSNQHMQSSSSSQGEKIKLSEEKIPEARDKMKEQI